MEEFTVNVTQNIVPTLSVQIVQNSAPVMNAEIVLGGGGGGGAPIVFGDTMIGSGTSNDPINVSNDILEQINENYQSTQENWQAISQIQAIIPTTAGPDNQLADQGFVNSSIQTATAYFRGDWATWADVPSDPALYPADATGNHTPITNDYMVVIADEKTNGGTWRYKYTGVWAEQGKDGWIEEYQINETPLTAAQLAALNSGITAQAVAGLADFVKKTDYATSATGGVVRTNSTYGIWSGTNGLLTIVKATDETISGKTSLYQPIVPASLDYAVKVGLTTNTIALTDEEKAAAQEWLGVESSGLIIRRL